jgi:hypothetical protein
MENTYSMLIVILLILMIVWIIMSRKTNRKPPFYILLLLIVIGAFVQYIGIRHDDTTPGNIAWIRALFSSIKMIGADFNHSTLQGLMVESTYYYIAALMSHILILFYTVYYFVSMIRFRTVNLIRHHRARLTDHYVIMGNENHMSSFIRSMKGKHRVTIVIDDRLGKTEEDIVEYYTLLNKEVIMSFIFGNIELIPFDRMTRFRRKDRKVYLVSLFEDEKTSIQCTHRFARAIGRSSSSSESVVNRHILGYVLYEQCDHADVLESVRRTKGQIRLFSRQDLIGRQFMVTYPLTELIPRSHISDQGSLKDVTYNYHFIGFGKFNQDLLKKVVSSNQYIETKINYFVYTRDLPERIGEFLKPLRIYHDEHLLEEGSLKSIESYYTGMRHKYLDVFDEPGTLHFYSVDVRKLDFLQKIKSRTTPGEDVNIFIVSLGNDVLNAKTTRELRVYLIDEGIDDNARLFMKITSTDYFDEIKHDRTNIIPFGMNDQTMTYTAIIDRVNERFAAAMQGEYMKKNKPWKPNNLKHKSNLYAALNIRTKLHLMGLDLSHDKPDYDWKAEYERIYNPNGIKPLEKTEKTSIEVLKAYYLSSGPLTFRDRLALMEKQRWNVFHLMNGWVPMPLDVFRKQVKVSDRTNNPSQNEAHQHVCLTSFEGLIEVASIMNTYGYSLHDGDYLQYDYVLMDNLPEHIEGYNTHNGRSEEDKIYIVRR